MTISQIFTTPPTDRREPAEQNCFELLEKLHIPFERVEHDPAFTMEDCREISEALYVQVCKNLFLCNRQQTQFYLLCMPASKTFKTKDLSGQLDVSRLSFAPAEKMQELLGVTPGSASILALMNDTEHQVQLLIDRTLYSKEYIGCHPCMNTGTLKMETSDVLNIFLPHCKHKAKMVDLPDYPAHEEETA
ncbi:MAG: prolyl-tRNA synthetase associated domain-containing protein [Oscillospiraceae bacterium]|jgi:Ala-tRNA(Pro) deacylase|nr:prolyl-tRNA synthetase associated domain-containing protein [Oscillospiraceae bacterium]MCI9587747.1 prolyl-tRNA synthetase associated domain-containing protein [Oscillospiraceae bacterium]